MVDPVAAAGPGLRSEDRIFGSHDLPVDEQANASQNHSLGIFKTASEANNATSITSKIFSESLSGMAARSIDN